MPGFPRLAETFGELVAKAVATWLHYNERAEQDPNREGAGARDNAGARTEDGGGARDAGGDGAAAGADYGGTTAFTDEPLDLIGDPELVGWPELTEDCLPAPLFRYVTAEAERLNVDPCPIAAHTLAACATSISDAWRIKPKRHDPWTQQARLWVCVVKDVGARGTEMIRSAFWPVKERNHELLKEWQCAHAAWKARQAGKKKDSDGDDPEPVCARLVTNDATVEAMSEILKGGSDQAKLTVLCDELVAFLGGFGRYTDTGSTARALMLEAYDGGPQHIDRIKRGNIYVPNWSVNVAGNIQPRRLAGMGKDLADDGLFQRFLTVHAKPAELGADDDKLISTTIGSDYRAVHQALAGIKPDSHSPAYVDDDGVAERKNFMRLAERLQVDPTLPTIIRETAPKWSGLLARLSLIFHVVDLSIRTIDGEDLSVRDRHCVAGGTVVTAATFLRRIALPNLFRLGFDTLPDDGATAAHVRWVAGYVLAHQSVSITARDIGRAYRPLRGKPRDIGQVMDVLVHAAWVAAAGDGRHDSASWNVNPAVHSKFAEAAAAEQERRRRVQQAVREKVSDL
jgi:hypothetical protein